MGWLTNSPDVDAHPDKLEGEESESSEYRESQQTIEVDGTDENEFMVRMDQGSPTKSSLPLILETAKSSTSGGQAEPSTSGETTEVLSEMNLENNSMQLDEAEGSASIGISSDSNDIDSFNVNNGASETVRKHPKDSLPIATRSISQDSSDEHSSSKRHSSNISESPINSSPTENALNGHGNESVRGALRDSIADAASSPTSILQASHTSPPVSPASTNANRDSVQSFHTFAEAGPSTSSSSSMKTHFSPSRRSANGGSPVAAPPFSHAESSNYDLLKQHVDAHIAQLEENPKAKRKSIIGQADLKASFDKMRLSSKHKRTESEDFPKLSESEEPTINWDFWGAIMADYEHMAKTRRKGFLDSLRSFWVTFGFSNQLKSSLELYRTGSRRHYEE